MTEHGGPCGEAPAHLYRGRVLHARLRPFGHRFVYRTFSVLLDLDRLVEADRLTLLFSVRRFNLLSFHPKDHGPRDGSDLRSHIDRLLAAEGVAPVSRVLLLCYPRVLGYVFNPLAIYYCYDAANRLRAIVYEVRNTFGEIHAYVAPVRQGEARGAEIRQMRAKAFYVSPFLGMDLRYHFRLRPPGPEFAVRILETDREGPIFCAAMKGVRERMTTGAVLRACCSVPLLTFKVMAAIHWQALLLWVKGAAYHAKPGAPGSPAPSAERPM